MYINCLLFQLHSTIANIIMFVLSGTLIDFNRLRMVCAVCVYNNGSVCIDANMDREFENFLLILEVSFY